MDLVTLLIFGIFVWFLSKLWRMHRPENYEILRKLPQPPSKPIVGVALDVKQSVLGMTQDMNRWCSEYGSPTAMKLFGKYLVHIHSPEHFEKMLKDTKNIEKGQPLYGFVRPWLGKYSLLLSDGEIWHRHRKLLTPTFHYQILRDFFPIIHDRVMVLVDMIKEKAKSKEAFDLLPMITHCALDIICETSMGVQLNSLEKEGHLYKDGLFEFSDIVMDRWMRPWLWNDWLFAMTEQGRKNASVIKMMHDFTRDIVHKRDNERKLSVSSQYSGEKRRLALLDALLDLKNRGEMTMEEVYNETETFSFEGHDTTSSAIVWGIYALGRHPEIQARVQKEMDDTLGPNRSELPNPEEINKLSYFEQCVKESQRIYPSVPIVERTLTHPLELDAKYTLPPGVNVVINMWMLHRNVNHWPDAEKYDPERFNSENIANRHPFAFCPFSGGPRNCIGQKFAYMELKAFLFHIFRNFEIEAIHSFDEMKMASQFVARPLTGLWVKVRERD